MSQKSGPDCRSKKYKSLVQAERLKLRCAGSGSDLKQSHSTLASNAKKKKDNKHFLPIWLLQSHSRVISSDYNYANEVLNENFKTRLSNAGLAWLVQRTLTSDTGPFLLYRYDQAGVSIPSSLTTDRQPKQCRYETF